MNKTLKTLTAALLLAAAFSCSKDTPDPAPLPPTPPPVAQKDIAVIDGLVSIFMEKYDFPGASLAISKGGKLVYRKGYGLADRIMQNPVAIGSRFRLTNLSESYTVVATLKLAEEGKLKLDDKVFGDGALLGTAYGTKPYSDAYRKITVRHLLEHRSGAFRSKSGKSVLDTLPALKEKEFFDWMLDNTVSRAEPGKAYDYYSANDFVMGKIIEKVTGKTYLRHLQEDLLKPIGGASVDLDRQNKSPKLPEEMTYYGQGSVRGEEYGLRVDRYGPSLRLVATATDALKFMNAIDGLDTRPDILSKASIDLMIAPIAGAGGYGMGFAQVKSQKIWFNAGAIPGASAGAMRHDNGMTVVLLFNGSVDYRDPSQFGPFSTSFRSLLLDIVENPQRDYEDIDQFK